MGLSRTEKKIFAIKKRRSLDAINQVNQFVKEIDIANPDLETFLYCAMQMLGRIREPGLVKHYKMPFSHGFSLLQVVWAENPLKMVQILTDLLKSSNNSFEVDTSVPGSKRVFEIDKSYEFKNNRESYVDSMLIAALYDVNRENDKKISTRLQDGMLARYLGIPVKQAKRSSSLPKKDKDFFKGLVNDLNAASKNKVSILTTFTGHLGLFLEYNDLSLSWDIPSFEKGVKKLTYVAPSKKTSQWYYSNRNPVLITKFEQKKVKGKDLVSLELRIREGGVVHLEMKEKTFFENFYYARSLLLNAKSDMEFEMFENMDDDAAIS